MSLLPLFIDDLMMSHRPSRIFDQHFGMHLDAEDLFSPLTPGANARGLILHPRYVRPWRSVASAKDTGSVVAMKKDAFQVDLDVQQFAPEEITVKASGDNTITIEGKHEEKQDEHGYISRHFVRKYVLPKGHDIANVVSKLSSDGVLTITAPKADAQVDETRTIPIKQTGAPSKAVEKAKEQEAMEN